jgi:hypothetical protein
MSIVRDIKTIEFVISQLMTVVPDAELTITPDFMISSPGRVAPIHFDSAANWYCVDFNLRTPWGQKTRNVRKSFSFFAKS